jgi:hypothetical protein
LEDDLNPEGSPEKEPSSIPSHPLALLTRTASRIGRGLGRTIRSALTSGRPEQDPLTEMQARSSTVVDPSASIQPAPQPARRPDPLQAQEATAAQVDTRLLDEQPELNVAKANSAGGLARIARPLSGLVDEAVETAAGLEANIAGLFGFTKESKGAVGDFLRWWDQRQEEGTVGVGLRQKVEAEVGPKPEGIAGVVEDLTQLGAGMLLVNKTLKTAGVGLNMAAEADAVSARGASLLRKTAGTVARMDVAGAIADFSFMDPYEQNFFGIVDRSPESTQTAFQRALAADPDQPETWNRLKNSLQGFVVGRAADRIISSTRAISYWRKAKKLPAGSPERLRLEGRIDAVLATGEIPREAVKAGATEISEDATKILTEDFAPAPRTGGRPTSSAVAFENELNQRLGIGLDAEGKMNDVAFRGPDGKGGVIFRYSHRGSNTIHLDEIHNLERGTGKGSDALQALVETADKNGITLSLNASPLPPLSKPIQKVSYGGEVPVTGSVFRETSLERVEDFLPSGNRLGLDPRDDVFVATDPSLALGQGSNRGVLMEFDAEPLNFYPNPQKPALGMVEAQGGGTELIARFNPVANYKQALKRVTVRPDALADNVVQSRSKLFLKRLEDMGWKRSVLEDGSVQFDRPATEGAAMAPEKLRDIYRKFGFRRVKEGESLMVREPGAAASEFREIAPQRTAKFELEVIEGPDGKFRIAMNGEEVKGPVFNSAGEANVAAANARAKLPGVDTETLRSVNEIKTRILSGHNPADVAGLVRGTAFNFQHITASNEARAWINAVAEAAPSDHLVSRQGMKETEEFAVEFFGGSTPQEALSIAREVLGDVENLPQRIWAIRAYQHATAQYIADLSGQIAAGQAPGVMVDNLRQALQVLSEMNPVVKRVGTRVGQSLNVFKGDVPLDGIKYVDPIEAAKRAVVTEAERVAQAGAKDANPTPGIFEGLTKQQIMGVAAHLRMSGGDPEVISRYIRDVLGTEIPKDPPPGWWQAFNAIRYNSMLSGPLSHMRNILGGLGLFGLKNAELMAHGLETGNKELFLQGWDQFSSIWMDSAEALHAFNQARKAGNAILDPGQQKEGLQEALEALGVVQDAPVPNAWLRAFHAPQTFLMAEDEFFKQLNYRGSVRAQALQEARRLFPNNPERWGFHVKQALDGAFTPTGAGINEAALHLARENTFTLPLQGSLKDIASIASRNSAGGRIAAFFFPFRNTPANIYLQTAERTPGLWRMSTLLNEELAGVHGPRRALEAKAKIEFGQTLWTVATGLAAAGYLTGGGPRDPDARKQWLSAGNVPYSIKDPVTGKWVSFKSIEPLSTILGLPADASEIWQDLSRQERKKDFEQLTSSFVLGVGASFYNKTFLQGIQNVSDILSGSDAAGDKLAVSLIRQGIPFYGLASQVNPDPLQREMNDVRERVLGGVPYFSEQLLEPVRTVLGKPLPKESWVERSFWPLTISEPGGTEDQALIRDLIEGLGEGVQIPLPQKRLEDGLIDLQDREKFKPVSGKDQSPYDRMLELYSEGITVRARNGMVRRNLPPVEVTLRAVIDGDVAKLQEIFGPSGYRFGYWNEARRKVGVDASDRDTRLGIVKGVLREYQQAAYQQVLEEYPALREAEDAIEAEKKGFRRSESQHRRSARLRSFADPAIP